MVHGVAKSQTRLGDFHFHFDFPGGSDDKVSVYNAGDPGSIHVSGRSPGKGNGSPLQYYCLENLIDRGAPWKKIYDQTRKHIKKQRHYFANKGQSSQSYGFSSSHVWM